MKCGTSENTNQKNNQMTFEYKGYEGFAEYRSEDGVYYGWILDIDALVDFIAESHDDIEKEFHLAVDDYIEFKKEIGRDD